MQISTVPEAELLVHDAAAQLPEGVRWDAARGRLLWVDITAGLVHALDPRSGRRTTWHVGAHVGAVAPRAAGGLVVADRSGFGLLAEDPDVPLERVADLLGPGLRMNDGACDAHGCFLAGSMAYDETPGAGALYRLDGARRVTTLLRGATVSNGIGWSPVADRMYYVDSGERRIDVFDYAPDGRLGARRALVEIPPASGVPDGIAVDEDGAIWVALWGGGRVQRYGEHGQLLAEIRLPVAQVTSCAFGGPDLDELYITTGAHELTAAERRGQPLAGALFRCRLGVRGRPATPYAG